LGLTAAERETVISASDSDDRWHVSTSQAKWVTKILRLKEAKILNDTVFDGTRMIEATIPLSALVGLRGDKDTTRAAATTRGNKGSHLKNVQRCTGHKDDGSECNMIAVKGTDRCRWHPKGE